MSGPHESANCRHTTTREQDERRATEKRASFIDRAVDNGRGRIARPVLDRSSGVAREEATLRSHTPCAPSDAVSLREQTALHELGRRDDRATAMATFSVDEVHGERRSDSDDANGATACDSMRADRRGETVRAQPPRLRVQRGDPRHVTS